MTANQYRDQGYTVVFFGGRVHIWRPGHPAMGQPIADGAWMKRPDGWEAESDEVGKRMLEIRAVCYCGCGVAACHYCMGVRTFPAGTSGPTGGA